jgi:hypothetical protein
MVSTIDLALHDVSHVFSYCHGYLKANYGVQTSFHLK